MYVKDVKFKIPYMATVWRLNFQFDVQNIELKSTKEANYYKIIVRFVNQYKLIAGFVVTVRI